MPRKAKNQENQEDAKVITKEPEVNQEVEKKQVKYAEFNILIKGILYKKGDVLPS